jgi:hypothetical protein
VARSTDTSAIPAAVVSSLIMVLTPRGRPSCGRFQWDISATARRLHPRLALGQRKPERDQVETAISSRKLSAGKALCDSRRRRRWRSLRHQPRLGEQSGLALRRMWFRSWSSAWRNARPGLGRK